MDLSNTVRCAFGGLIVKSYKGGQLPDGSTLEPGISYRLLILFPDKRDWEVLRIAATDGPAMQHALEKIAVGQPIDVTFDPRKFGNQPFRCVSFAPVAA